MPTKTKKRIRPYIPRKQKLLAAIGSEHLPDIRQTEFLAYYLDRKSETFCNAYQSALRAGYSQQYAESITAKMPSWLAVSVGNNNRLALAEAHFQEVLEMPVEHQAMGAFGPIFEKRETFVSKKLKNGKVKKVKKVEKIPVMTINTTRIKEKTRVAEIISEALAPETYGRRNAGPKVTFNFNASAARNAYS